MSDKAHFTDLKIGLATIFGTEVKEQGRTLKTLVKEVLTDQLHALSTLAKDADAVVNIKRSGTQVTILLVF